MIAHPVFSSRFRVMASCVCVLALACGRTETAPVFEAEDELSKITLLRLPPSERFPAEASYFKLLLQNGEIQALKSGLRTSEALADLQSVDYYLNFGLRQDVRLIHGADTIYPSTYFREDYTAELPHESVLVGFDLPAGARSKFRLEGPLVAEALEIDLSSPSQNSAR